MRLPSVVAGLKASDRAMEFDSFVAFRWFKRRDRKNGDFIDPVENANQPSSRDCRSAHHVRAGVAHFHETSCDDDFLKLFGSDAVLSEMTDIFIISEEVKPGHRSSFELPWRILPSDSTA